MCQVCTPIYVFWQLPSSFAVYAFRHVCIDVLNCIYGALWLGGQTKHTYQMLYYFEQFIMVL